MSKLKTAIILAAGKSTRTYPITLDIPKALLKVLNVPIIQRTLDEIDGLVEEVILVVGNKKEMIREFVGNQYKSMKIEYVEQKELSGTGSALIQVQDRLKGRFLVINGDDLYKRNDIEKLLENDYGVLAQTVAEPSRFGVFVVDAENNLVDLIEKPKEKVGNLANTGCYLFHEKIFEHELTPSPRGEYEITDYLLYFAKQEKVKVVPVSEYWLALGYSWDLLKINQYVLQHDFGPESRLSAIPQGVMLYGKVSLGENITFGKNVHIVGPALIGNNVTIGKDTYILPDTVIENNVTIEEESIVAESLIMDHSVLHRDAKKKGAIVMPKYTIALN